MIAASEFTARQILHSGNDLEAARFNRIRDDRRCSDKVFRALDGIPGNGVVDGFRSIEVEITEICLNDLSNESGK